MSRIVKIGNIEIGGGNPVAIQSMTNTKTKDIQRTLKQIGELEKAGCQIVRLSVPDNDSLEALPAILKGVSIPLVADIHFDYKLAIGSIKAGISKIRLNPGNIGDNWKVEEVVRAAKDFKIPIRVGANSGSIKKQFQDYPKEIALGESALEEVRILEKLGFEDIVISVKSSSVKETVLANKYVHERTDYPLHIGVTEAGIGNTALTKSAIGIGALLLENIGDTIRVSIAGDPVNEVIAARDILKSLELFDAPDIVACPTCARTEIAVEDLAKKVTFWLDGVNEKIKVAIMGCVVNGIGEGKDADIGIAGTRNGGVIFVKGNIIDRVENKELEKRFKEILTELLSQRSS